MSNTKQAERLRQTLSHFQPTSNSASAQSSILAGPTEPPLLSITLGQLLRIQASNYTNHECLVAPWTKARWTYADLDNEADHLARGMLAMGIQKGDRVGIMAGNCEQYVSVFFAASRVGAILVVLNNNYTPSELYYALDHSGCNILFITPLIGKHNLQEVLAKLGPMPKESGASKSLHEVVILRGVYHGFSTYNDIIVRGTSQAAHVVKCREAELEPNDVCQLQFTSGSTGDPKAAMLTHYNLVNNSRFIGNRLNLTPADVLCCPPPLFHCFGLVLGMLAVVTCGSKIVLPSEIFDPKAILHAVSEEKCSAIHGVPTMFQEILSIPKPKNFDVSNMRTGIIAGAPVPRPLMERLFEELNMTEFTSSYGLTEASPTCFNAYTTDGLHARLNTVGKIMPHARAKVADTQGNPVPIGQRGELCLAGYQVMKGYWKNPAKTAETLAIDCEGTIWLKTGDEAFFNKNGYCTITGRFKDIIIRGGENIYPLEIEERLTEHPAVELACVIGIPDRKYGEVVGAFIQLSSGKTRPSDEDLRVMTQETLGRHKTPRHIFVFGEGIIPSTVPVTGSGKVRKVELRQMATVVLDQRGRAA
ncbi:hypothetical protein N7452_011119 [Penicillium brevicompactum]|uniref:Uncharacterized protein n=1 Tax=Penicillium brevicompactum TaxID=5074 RepID=A0A9W9Q1H4_PENBR|nr:hypothetical protein N7452_011119 [Penicillium brevicompactum]